MKLSICAFSILLSLSVDAQPVTYSVANAHSHNDYENKVPFFAAYNEGFGSIEADIFLMHDSLFVAHDIFELAKKRTLETYYLKPLEAALLNNHGYVYKDRSKQLQLLIDVKTDSIATLNKLIELLQQYPSLINNPGLKFVISGNRPAPSAWINYPSYILFDGRPYENYSQAALGKIGLISDDFTNYSKWNGKGSMNETETAILKSLINKAHSNHKPFRLWALPDNEPAWQQMMHLGVDYINTDRIKELSVFLASVGSGNAFPEELVHFVPYKNNPVFAGTGTTTWDNQIRERGYILREGNTYHLWYTGYTDINDTRYLGYATSPDGYTWTRYKGNPIHNTSWVEDMCVVKSEGTYYMFAEGKGDTAHLLTSTDRVNWTEKGNLDIRGTNGQSISKGPYGTPFVFKENGIWYLFYERDDLGIWLATSKDLKVFTNVQDEPVLKMGPEAYDQYAVAMNQVIKYKGLYYGYYHASAFKDWHDWSTNVAVSKDLVHWQKYANNPIVGNNQSSGILVNDGKRYRLYTMHPEVNVLFPATDSLP